ncbi:hypothetical protein Cch01nite_24440 [Cellulomonas chitinilytica]|uniref:N-acetyltransferase domain-containing protein n=1 Tax=Cellulomonas chitinilytica TaxID=398759 RepID=A0A919P3S1_9CELL|nr:GNAT family N-acetyltransferase [Cellulomonas chitinilytica]GIG21720.1 hypothetical protein Cch01nite_24440 [Cellulomonas chitinilytica]
MAITLTTPTVDELGHVVRTLRDWQDDASPMQLHPGDLGWYSRFGVDALAGAVRTWRRSGRLLAIGLLDGANVLRATVALEAWRDEELAHQVVSDVSDPERGVLPTGKASVEAPNGTRVQDLLSDVGWSTDESWTPLRRDLTKPVEPSGLRVEVIGLGEESEFTAVHRSAWGSAQFTDERWRAMAAGLLGPDVRCLIGRDAAGVAVAGVTVWSAGPGKPGLLEPMGVHAQHRGQGYGRAVCLAAAAELQRSASSSALVCTPSSLGPAIATYASAGFQRLPERRDRSRDA